MQIFSYFSDSKVSSAEELEFKWKKLTLYGDNLNLPDSSTVSSVSKKNSYFLSLIAHL